MWLQWHCASLGPPVHGRGSWFVFSEGLERAITAVVQSEMYILRISMSYNNFFLSFQAGVWLQDGVSEMFLM